MSCGIATPHDRPSEMKHAGLSLLVSLNLLSAFLTQIVVVAALGPAHDTDALLAASAAPQFLLSIVAVAASAILLPWFSAVSVAEARASLARLLGVVTVSVIGLALLLAISAPHWLRALFSAFEDRQLALCTELVRIQLLGLVVASANLVVSCYWQSQDRFRFVEGATLLSFALSLCALFFALPRFGVAAAAWAGVLQATILCALILNPVGKASNVPAAEKHDLRPRLQGVSLLLAGSAYLKSDPLIDRHLMSMSHGGELTLYFMAQQVVLAISGVLSKSFGLPALPTLSRLAGDGKTREFLDVYRKKIALLALLSLCFLLGLLESLPLMARAAASYSDAALVENVQIIRLFIACFGGALIFTATGSVISGGYYALSDTRTPVLISAITFTISIACRYLAYLNWGAAGLALAVSGYFAINALLLSLLLLIKLRRKVAVDEGVSM